jgi:hypothetical protein
MAIGFYSLFQMQTNKIWDHGSVSYKMGPLPFYTALSLLSHFPYTSHTSAIIAVKIQVRQKNILPRRQTLFSIGAV